MVSKTETQIVYKRKTASMVSSEFSNGQIKNEHLMNSVNDKIKSSVEKNNNIFNLSNINNNNNNVIDKSSLFASSDKQNSTQFKSNQSTNNDINNNSNKVDSTSEIIEEIEEDIILPAQIGTDPTFKRKIVWFNAIGFLVLHILGLIGLYLQLAGYTKIWTFIFSVFLTVGSGLGVTMGAHRLFTHKTYKAKTWLRVTLLILQTMAGQNCLYIWVRDHRQHHKYSDTDADPHNATRGFFFSHVGWLMSRKHPKVIEYGKKIDMSDLESDPWIMFQKRHYKKLYVLFTLLIPTAIPCLLWGEDPILSFFATFFARTAVGLNLTWSVNSVAHMFGTKPYDKNMLPVESKFVSIIAAGEGWHNYHHTFPFDYRTAELGMPYNLTTTLIDWFASKGHIWDRRIVSEATMKSRILRTGDGSHHKYGTSEEANNVDEIVTKVDDIPEMTTTVNDLSSLSTDNTDPLRKYIVDKKQISTNMLDKLESCNKIDGINNNEMSDFNANVDVKKLKGKESLNVST